MKYEISSDVTCVNALARCLMNQYYCSIRSFMSCWRMLNNTANV